MSKIDEFKGKIVFDEHALDVALRDHPGLVFDIGVELAIAISVRDEAKQSFDEIEAKVDGEIRRAAAVADEKVTEKEVESQKKLDRRVQAANKAYLERKLDAAKWSALKEAFEQRSYALSKLVELYLNNYYSDRSNAGAEIGRSDLNTAKAQQVKQVNRSRRVNP